MEVDCVMCCGAGNGNFSLDLLGIFEQQAMIFRWPSTCVTIRCSRNSKSRDFFPIYPREETRSKFGYSWTESFVDTLLNICGLKWPERRGAKQTADEIFQIAENSLGKQPARNTFGQQIAMFAKNKRIFKQLRYASNRLEFPRNPFAFRGCN